MQVIAPHLYELNTAMKPDWPIAILEHSERRVPAVYDVRKSGLAAAVKSALGMRKSFAALLRDRRTELVFDRMTLREHFLAAGCPRLALPGGDNIYLAYRDFARAHDLAFEPLESPKVQVPGVLGIFPGSRVGWKNVPFAVVNDLFARASELGLVTELLLLEDERPELEDSAFPKKIIPRSFAAMIEAVGGCSAIISADSMPAHLAEAAGRPIHVLLREPNPYWLPLSAFDCGRWSLFDGQRSPQLQEFLHAAAQPCNAPTLGDWHQ